MKITDFKKGDLIHRTKPRKIERGFSMLFPMGSGTDEDRSFMDEPIEFVSVKSNLFFYKYIDKILAGKVYSTSIDNKMDDWDYYPTEFLESEEIIN